MSTINTVAITFRVMIFITGSDSEIHSPFPSCDPDYINRG